MTVNKGKASLLLGLCLALGCSALAQVVDAQVNLTKRFGTDVAFAVAGPNVHVAYREATGPGPLQTLFFARSTDGGHTFSEPVALAGNEALAFAQKVAASEDHVYVVWRQRLGTSSSFIMVRHSADRGQSFSPAHTISPIGSLSTVGSPLVQAAGEDVYIAWSFREGEGWDVFLRLSRDGGETFGDPVNVTNDPVAGQRVVDLLARGNDLYIEVERPQDPARERLLLHALIQKEKKNTLAP